MTTHALMELADRLAALPKISESGRNDDGVEGVAIPGVDCYDFDDLMKQAATQLRTAASEGGEADGCDDSVVGMQTNIAIVRNVLNGKHYGDENASREMALELLEWIGQHAIAAEMAPADSGAGRDGTCEWTFDEVMWETGCGQSWQFTVDGPAENNYRFCHGCGKPIAIAGAAGETK